MQRNIMVLLDSPYTFPRMKAILKILEHLPKNYKLFIVSLENKKPELNRDYDFYYLYDHPAFSKSDIDLERAEEFLNYPLNLLIDGFWLKKYQEKWKQKIYPKYVAQLAEFWEDYLVKNKIDIYFSILECSYPHTVAYSICERLNIKVIYFAISRIGGSIMFLDNHFMPIYKITPNKDRIEELYPKVLESTINKAKPFKMSISKIKGRFKVPNITASLHYFKSYFDKTFFEKLNLPSPSVVIQRYFRHIVRLGIVPLFYKKVNLHERYFLYPLPHFDEAYNSYYHGMYDIFENIKLVSRALPHGVYLYVKPHPHFSGSDVPISKLMSLSRLNNVKIIPHNANSKELNENCVGVITVGGTAGFEGILYNKPVIVFGKPFYSEPGTVLVVNDLMELPRLLLKVIKNPNYGISTEKRKEMAVKYYLNQIPLKGSPNVFGEMNLSDEEAIMLGKELDARYSLLINKEK